GIRNGMQMLLEKAEEKKVGWIRIEPETEEALEEIKKAVPYKVTKAPHDMQPKEVFVVDITKDREALLAQMKPKTRYNIGLAEKRGVKVFATREEKYKQAFLDLIVGTSLRKEIVPHPRAYYEQFFSAIPQDMCQLFVAEYEGKVLAANILMLFGTRAIYLHGGSGNEHREVMAPYLLQWKQMQYAKEKGCTEYDFGGVRAMNQESGIRNHEKERSDWSGITRFKIGFSPQTKPIVFPGSYDMILDSAAYFFYNFFRRLNGIIHPINIF
ncbi:MAG: peptidoglycan bridge formation glycyltransferase FemA/FemB family protein, partial [bacterium]|nr:peptidoglycan bridge formation glycyltransferase FemA/FemB family protein [bacterium]